MTLFRRHVPGWTVRALQILVAATLLALLWRAADGPEAARSIAAADWRWLAFALLALTVQTILSALRWRLTARQLGIGLDLRDAIGEYYLSQIVNQSLPGGMVGDAARAVRSRGQAGLVAAGEAVVFERLAGQIAIFTVMSLAFVATLAVPGGLDWPPWLALPVALLIAAGISLPVLVLAGAHVPGAAGRAVRTLRSALHTALATRAALPGQIALSVGTTVCNLLAFAVCARAVGVDLSFAATAALVPLILFTMLIPISVSGWGLREGAAAALLPIAGATASGGLAASIAFGLTVVVSVLPGALLLGVGWRPGGGAGTTPTGNPAPAPHSTNTLNGTIRRGSSGCF